MLSRPAAIIEYKSVPIRIMTDRQLLDAIAEVERNAPASRRAEIMVAENLLARVHGDMAEWYLEGDLRTLQDMSDQEFLLSDNMYVSLLREAVFRRIVDSNDYGLDDLTEPEEFDRHGAPF